LTGAACPSEPRHANAVADLKTLRICAQCGNGADDFVTGYERQFWLGQFTVDDVKEIVESHLVGGQPVERLRMKD
jgi:(2Fe-2S) ferredoxin